MKQKCFNIDVRLEVVFMWSWYGLWKRKIEWIISSVLFTMLKKTEYIQLFSIVEGSWQKQMCSMQKGYFESTPWMIFSMKKSDAILFNWLLFKIKGKKINSVLVDQKHVFWRRFFHFKARNKCVVPRLSQKFAASGSVSSYIWVGLTFNIVLCAVSSRQAFCM